MTDYIEKEQVIEVPKATGVDGFLLALQQVLKLPRVAQIVIDARGSVKVKRWIRKEDADTTASFFHVDFEGLYPYSIIRNGEVLDLGYANDPDPLRYLAAMFEAASLDHMFCVSFVGGANSVFYDWCKRSGVSFRDEVFGLPLLRDRFIEDDVLLLCTAFGRGGGMQDVRKSYKITLPREEDHGKIG